MDSYGGIASVYDHLVAGVDFGSWIDYVESLTGHFGYTPGSVLDLACGTGNTLIPFAARGYRAFGVDISPEMIAVAGKKAAGMALEIVYHVGDMREFKLAERVDLVTCFHDGLNYMTEPDDLRRVFGRAVENLCEDGLFVFDMNAVRWIGGVDRHPAVLEEENITVIYESDYNPVDSVWAINITCFAKEGDLFRKFSETHRERGYPPGDVQDMLECEGFSPLAVYDAFTFNPPHSKSRRHFYVARKR